MKSVHQQLALRKDFDFLSRYHMLTVCQVGLTTSKTECIGKMTRRSHSGFAKKIYNPSRTW